jgi:hypothetical protein
MTMTGEQSFAAGNVELRVENRTLGEDGGPAVEVFADVDGAPVQVLRFDCFQRDPHYHYDPSGVNDKRDLSPDQVPDPIAWTLEQLRHHLPEMIRTAGFESTASNVDQTAVAGVLPEVESIMRGTDS